MAEQLTKEQKAEKAKANRAKLAGRVISAITSLQKSTPEQRAVFLGGIAPKSLGKEELLALVSTEKKVPTGMIDQAFADWIIAETDIVKKASAVSREAVDREYPAWIDALETPSPELIAAGTRFYTNLKAFEEANNADLVLMEGFGEFWQQYFRADKGEESKYHTHKWKTKEAKKTDAEKNQDEATK